MLVVKQSLEDIEKGLQSWDWLDFSAMVPIVTSCFGDVFFRSKQACFFLDTLGGTLEKVAGSTDELREILNSEDGQDHYLMADLALAAQESGMNIGPGECLDFKVAPVLNGPLTLDNLEITPFALSLDIAGQLMKQLKNFPPGAKIDKITVDGI